MHKWETIAVGVHDTTDRMRVEGGGWIYRCRRYDDTVFAMVHVPISAEAIEDGYEIKTGRSYRGRL